MAYHTRVSIDLKITVGLWYSVRVQAGAQTQVKLRDDLVDRPVRISRSACGTLSAFRQAHRRRSSYETISSTDRYVSHSRPVVLCPRSGRRTDAGQVTRRSRRQTGTYLTVGLWYSVRVQAGQVTTYLVDGISRSACGTLSAFRQVHRRRSSYETISSTDRYVSHGRPVVLCPRSGRRTDAGQVTRRSRRQTGTYLTVGLWYSVRVQAGAQTQVKLRDDLVDRPVRFTVGLWYFVRVQAGAQTQVKWYFVRVQAGAQTQVKLRDDLVDRPVRISRSACGTLSAFRQAHRRRSSYETISSTDRYVSHGLWYFVCVQAGAQTQVKLRDDLVDRPVRISQSACGTLSAFMQAHRR